MVNQRTIIKWSFISLLRKENIISGLVFLIICILCVISMPVVSLSERIVLLFDGYRYQYNFEHWFDYTLYFAGRSRIQQMKKHSTTYSELKLA